MRATARLRLSTLAAVVALAMSTGLASAIRSIDVEPTGPISMTSDLTFAGAVLGSNVQVICLVTLIGTLHGEIAKTTNSLAGYITSGAARGCQSNIGSLEPETALTWLLPMHIQMNSLTGTLPEITGGRLRILLAYLIRTRAVFRNGCLYTGNIDVGAAENPIERLTVEASGDTARLSRTLEGVCPGSGLFAAVFALSPLVEIILLE